MQLEEGERGDKTGCCGRLGSTMPTPTSPSESFAFIGLLFALRFGMGGFFRSVSWLLFGTTRGSPTASVSPSALHYWVEDGSDVCTSLGLAAPSLRIWMGWDGL